MRSTVRLVAMAGVLLIVGACGAGGTPTGVPTGAGGGGQTPASGGGSTAVAAVTDPCSLLTQAEVAAVVGKPVGPGATGVEPKTCDWQYPADGVPTIQVSITIQTGHTLVDLCGPSNPALGLTVTTVAGVGDGACFAELSGLGAGTNLTFVSRGQVFTVAAVLGTGATTAAVEAADNALAQAALAHIG